MKNILRMKNFNILGVDWKTWGGGGRGHEKPIYRGELSKRGGLDSFFI